MRKLFFIVCCFLTLSICLAEEWWKDSFIIGAHWGPALHHKYNNVDSPLVRDFTLLKDGGFNFIVGRMNSHNQKAEIYMRDNNNLNLLIQECNDSGFLFLNEAEDPNIIYGIDIKDEPWPQDTLTWLGMVRNLKQTAPDKLGFINLLPSHGFGTFDIFKTYANAYLGDTTLQVACFDNYNPHSQFSTHYPDLQGNYYSNIAYMKLLAGSRPLWAYLRSSEKFLEEKDSAWQDAYIRLGAFAPLAFGAKGIVYFCYDCKERNMILRSPGRGSWGSHVIFFDNDEKSRQIFFGNLKRDSTSLYPDLAIHTNDSLGTWRIKETDNSGVETNQKLLTIGTWFGDHNNNIPNIYNWDFTSDGYDKFTTITSYGRLLLSMFRNGWTHYTDISDFPDTYWSTMSRYTCPFTDFNNNKLFDLCLGWTENGHGKLRICMDCHLDPSHTPTPRNNPMLFDNTSQVFTFNSPIKQVIARNDSIWAITSNPDSTYINSDSLYILKYSNNLFNSVDTFKITLPNKMDHYWMEETLHGQDNGGDVWGEVEGQAYSLTNRIQGFSSGAIYVWGQYNNRSHQYDRYGLAAEGRSGFQTYALLNRKGHPNRIYQTARTINKFINDSISPIIMNNEWLGAYFSSVPNQSVLDSLKIINKTYRGATIPNPLPLISDTFNLSDDVLFGLFMKDNYDLNLLVINMRNDSRNLVFCIDHHAQLPQLNQQSPCTYRCDKITRMNFTGNSSPDVHTNYTRITLENMLGGECAILHLTRIPIP